MAVDELSEIPLDGKDSADDLDVAEHKFSEDFDGVQDYKRSQEEDLAKDLDSIDDINEDPELIEEPVDSSEDLDIDPEMSIDDLDEDEDEISSDATEISADDEAGFEEKLANSIEEESKLIQDIENDENEDERKSALNFLDDDNVEAEFKEIEVDIDLAKDETVTNIKDYTDTGVKPMTREKLVLI